MNKDRRWNGIRLKGLGLGIKKERSAPVSISVFVNKTLLKIEPLRLFVDNSGY